MELYLILREIFSFIIALCSVLSLGKLYRLIRIKKLFPEATLKDIQSFEKNTKRTRSFWSKRKNNKQK